MTSPPRSTVSVRCAIALLVLVSAGTLTAQQRLAPSSPAAPSEDLLNADQLQSLVAPIALYPDALLAWTLVASTYPLEMIQLQQWLAKHPDLKGEALADSVAKQPWDPSVQSMAAVPEVVKRLADGYTSRTAPFHGYYFKVLKGQGPAAPLGELDFVVQGAMIGGFALVAAPADYGVTGIMTFIVSHDGIVYQKDLGEQTSELFQAMERYDPDPTWTAVPQD